MTDIVNLVGLVFSWLWSTKIFNVPILLYFVGMAVIALLISFLKGKK